IARPSCGTRCPDVAAWRQTGPSGDCRATPAGPAARRSHVRGTRSPGRILLAGNGRPPAYWSRPHCPHRSRAPGCRAEALRNAVLLDVGRALSASCGQLVVLLRSGSERAVTLLVATAAAAM